MILDDCVLHGFENQQCEYLSPDSPDACSDIKWFKQYSHKVSYSFNSRGFRDSEWPNDLESAIWCIGDSFTVGLGSTLAHTWVNLLRQTTGQRCVNVSMHGASNQWIARKAGAILRTIQPRNMVIHWSFLHRREQSMYLTMSDQWQKFYNSVRAPDWPDATFATEHLLPDYIQAELAICHQGSGVINDLHRELHFEKTADWVEDINHTVRRCHLVESVKKHSNVVHSIIPKYAHELGQDRFQLQLNLPLIKLQQIDWSRDRFHYDLLTAQNFVQQIIPLLK